MKQNNNYKQSIAHTRPIPFEIYSFIGIVKTYYDFPPNVSDHIVDIFSKIGVDYHQYFGTIPYENAVLGITLFSIREFNKRFHSESPPFDITEFITLLYGEEKRDYHIKQVYYVLVIINATFGKTEYPIDLTALPTR